MGNSEYTILVVDNDEEVLRSTKSCLERSGYQVHAAMSGFEAVEKVSANPFLYALVILDYDMPGMNGGETARKLVELNKDIFICIFSAVIHISLKAANIEFLEKGNTKPEIFLAVVSNWCRKFEETTRVALKSTSTDENEEIINSVGLVGRSQALADIVRRALRHEEVKSEVSMLIRGESGTGKERIAKLFHERSSRKNGPFIAVNMGSIPANLVESELFGHKKGSFTGANQDRDGKFKAAEGGTLFLDEIGDTSLDVQVKLLRVLQEREYTPVGRNDVVKANVRIIAATNKDLEKAIEEGSFRADLYYRLNGGSIFIPPLRERVKDIEPVIISLCRKYNSLHGTRKAFLKSTVQLMEKFYWKGNIRDLENVVQLCLTEEREDKIPPSYFDPSGTHKAPHKMAPGLKGEYEELTVRHEEEIRRFFTRVLNRCNSQRQASLELGIPQTTLIDTLEKFALPTDFKKAVSTSVSPGGSVKLR